MKRKIFKKKISSSRGLVLILILVVLLLVGLWASQNIVQTRGKAATSNCLSEGKTGCYTKPCCPGLKCSSDNRCVKGTTAPTPTPKPACVMIRIGCGPIKCGGMNCSAGSACYQNSCYPTNTVCKVENACSTNAPTPRLTPTPTPGCTYSYRNVGCGPRQCGPTTNLYCQKKYMCREKTQRCGSNMAIGFSCEYGHGCK